MHWTGDLNHDTTVSLMDESETAILGQIIRQPNSTGWKALDYCANNGDGKAIGIFQSALGAKDAVELSVERMNK